MNLIPFEDPPEVTVQKTELKPLDPKDSRNLWQRFVDGLRQHIGLKPLYLTERFAVARIREVESANESREVDNQVKLLQAKLEYERFQVEARQAEQSLELERQKAAEDIRLKKEQTKREKANRNLSEQAAKLLSAAQQTREEAIEVLKDVIARIELHGGDVEINLPELSTIEAPAEEVEESKRAPRKRKRRPKPPGDQPAAP